METGFGGQRSLCGKVNWHALTPSYTASQRVYLECYIGEQNPNSYWTIPSLLLHCGPDQAHAAYTYVEMKSSKKGSEPCSQ